MNLDFYQTSEMKEKIKLARDFIVQYQHKIEGVLNVPTVISPTGLLPNAHTVNTNLTAIQPTSLALLSRIYIGGINFEITENELKQVFLMFGPIRGVTMSVDASTQKHKGYAFIEYEIPESAAMAVECLNGAHLGGRIIKVGRPTNFPVEFPADVPKPIKNRIFLANIHEAVGQLEILKIFSSFGKIRSCVLLKDPNNKDKHLGIGYVEFTEIKSAQVAISSMNNFDLGGKQLKVSKTVVGGDLPNDDKEKTLTPTHNGPVIVLYNISSINEVDQDFELDIKEEISKYGTIKSLIIKLDKELKEPEQVKVFIEFLQESEALNCIKVMNQRWFAGRKIECKSFPLQKFQSHDFSI